MGRILFLLSPAHCGGRRAKILMNPDAEFALARRLREPPGLALGEAFAFMSGLYFRGKLAYAQAFSCRGNPPGVLVITPGRGLLEPEQPIGRQDLLEMAEVPVALEDARYRGPLERDAKALASGIGGADEVVLLGSIATDKYVSGLLDCLGGRLLFPGEFVGRGDMSRGGLMLRAVLAGRELSYIPLAGAVRSGPRPPKLEPIRRRTIVVSE